MSFLSAEHQKTARTFRHFMEQWGSHSGNPKRHVFIFSTLHTIGSVCTKATVIWEMRALPWLKLAMEELLSWNTHYLYLFIFALGCKANWPLGIIKYFEAGIAVATSAMFHVLKGLQWLMVCEHNAPNIISCRNVSRLLGKHPNIADFK